MLSRAAQLLREASEGFARLEALDTGRPLDETRSADIPSVIETLEWFAGQGASHFGEQVPMSGNSFAYTRREALGVCAGIGAWNYPLQGLIWKVAPALVAGNAILFKPAEATPLSALRMIELLQEAGLPEGLFGVLLGGPSIGEALANHDGVAKVSPVVEKLL